ncbi:hypothetical protein FHX42_001462 [Saccharopolyspora lacisalsi]|uniref:Uncharacterized protein n=1 Tax=Halosaccharopolyspora lacisalsi TaxID=1000566 RepID=A0A839DST7_9PSEU|nr:hypothetical protein [Halosaccharopolyspora lacisalsi]
MHTAKVSLPTFVSYSWTTLLDRSDEAEVREGRQVQSVSA